MNTVASNLKAISEKAEEIRDRAAHSLENAADTIRNAGSQSADAITGFTGGAGRKLDTTAAMVRNPCLRSRAMSGFRGAIRRNPMLSLALAAAIGLVAGISCRAAYR
ncbi:MAG TPA: hypothetical protein VHC72_11595 [Bryobacteraceae bacterium]|jgi:ElaB/YqjD/DUF883 family membrane-anchored ribosome-binding protein|nr:hypothetical protein [Bryobacteraceae bacterium]